MLNFNVYKNSLYMMLSRGFEDAEEMIATLEKERPSPYIYGTQYHNIGYNFEAHLRSDLKEIEERYMMSYCFENKVNQKKVYVIFGTNNKAFLEVLTSIVLDSLDKDTDFTVSFCLVLNKDFNVKYASRIDEMSLRFNLRRHLDHTLYKPPFHSLGSKYSLMTEEEVAKLLSEAKISKKQMKKISWNCPMMAYYDYPRGSVVRVHRTPNISGSLISGELAPDYRLVV